jgi:glutathione S-transferase
MERPVLILGDKNISSWSMRPWLALKHAGIDFDEQLIRLDRPDTKATIRARSPSGKVPALDLGGTVIGESLAICEWAAEQVPSLWPSDPIARAVARSVSAEMHAGFAAMRRELPMDIRRRMPKEPAGEARADVDRIIAMWTECRARFGESGDFLFGAFSIADCMYAPVVTRFRTYDVSLPQPCARYAEAVLAHPAVRAWCEAAERE